MGLEKSLIENLRAVYLIESPKFPSASSFWLWHIDMKCVCFGCANPYVNPVPVAPNLYMNCRVTLYCDIVFGR